MYNRVWSNIVLLFGDDSERVFFDVRSSDCTSFLFFAKGKITMKHAYLITVHKNFKILNLLLEVLDDVDNDFFILIDKKIKEKNTNLLWYAPRFSQIFLLPRITINWAGFSQIEAIMVLLRNAVSKKYDYYHYMQGSDFPIKSKEEISDFFEHNRGREFVCLNTEPSTFAHYKCDYYHLFVDNRFYRQHRILHILNHTFVYLQKALFFRRKTQVLYSGSALFCITDSFARFILQKEKAIRKRYRYTLAADEVFIQTLIMESGFSKNLIVLNNRSLNCYQINWEKAKGNSPYTYMISDYAALKTCPNHCLFARKFDEDVDYSIVKRLYYDFMTK